MKLCDVLVCISIGTHRSWLVDLKLSKNPSDYRYLSRGGCYTIDGVDDKSDFIKMCAAMDAIGIDKNDQASLFSCIAGIMHIGNIQFVPTEDRLGSIIDDKSKKPVKDAAAVLGLDENTLISMLTTKTVRDMSKSSNNMKAPLDVEKVRPSLIVHSIFSLIRQHIRAMHWQRRCTVVCLLGSVN